MIVSFSVCARDEAIACATLDWAFSLDGKLPNDCILSFGEGVNREPIVASAEKLFRKVTVLNSDAPDAWPQGKNGTFQSLVRYLDDKKIKDSWLWLEPDSIPLKKGWLTAIEEEHKKGGKPFTGYIHPALNILDCVAVYPGDFIEYSPTQAMLCRAAPWDRVAAPEIIQHAHFANHLFQMVHDVDGFPPTFGKGPGSLPLEFINKDAVLFHNCKDNSLIEQLSKGTIRRAIDRIFSGSAPTPVAIERIVVVMPVCAKDIAQAIHHARWLQKLGVKWSNRAIIAFDSECPANLVTELNALLTYSFSMVEQFVYPTPKDKTYPAVANWVFARVAEYMSHGTAPWLWCEADSVVLKQEWLDVLQKEYEAGRKPFMGPVIRESGFGHMNGVAVYPADTVRRIPRALRSSQAWDWAMKEEMIGDCCDASHVIQNLWGTVDGRASQTNGNNPPKQFTKETARKLVMPSAALLHRVKDSSLTELLMNGGWR